MDPITEDRTRVMIAYLLNGPRGLTLRELEELAEKLYGSTKCEADASVRLCYFVLLPAAFGIRMCSRCPHCNVDENDPDFQRSIAKDVVCACQDILGHSTKPMGGYAGLAAAMAFATEFQGNGTPHGHGFVALCNLYQNGSLQDIADFIAEMASKLGVAEAIQRITSFIGHLHREDH